MASLSAENFLKELQVKKEMELFKELQAKKEMEFFRSNFCNTCERKMCKDGIMFEYFCPKCGLCKEIDGGYFTSGAFREAKPKRKIHSVFLEKNLKAFLGECVCPVLLRQVEIVFISLQEANPNTKKLRHMFFIPKILDLILSAEDPIREKLKQKHKENIKPLTKTEKKNELYWNLFLAKHGKLALGWDLIHKDIKEPPLLYAITEIPICEKLNRITKITVCRKCDKCGKDGWCFICWKKGYKHIFNPLEYHIGDFDERFLVYV